MVRARFLITGLLLAGAIAIPALASGTARRVVGNCTKSQVRPATIIIACADANESLTQLRWSSFGGRTARATGQYYVNDCTPNCAAGKFHSYPVDVALSDALPCPDKYDDYRTVSWKWAAKPPPGLNASAAHLSCPLPG